MQTTQSRIREPSAALAGTGPAIAIRRAFLATRPAFLVASVMPVLVGTAWAAAAMHRFNGTLFYLALLATLLTHAGTNVYNDVGDDVIGTDPANTGRIYPYTGGSRFIQAGILSRREMTQLAIGLWSAALVIGIVLTLLRGPGVILLGIAGLSLGLLYSLPGAQLSARGVGEAAVAVGLGVLPVLGAVWLQTGWIDSGALLLCIPVSCWVAAILVINEVPDVDADRLAHKRTLVVRWGAVGARVIHRLLTGLAVTAVAVAVALRDLPVWYLIPALVLAAAGLHAANCISMAASARTLLKRGIEMTLGIQAIGCSLLVIAVLVGRHP
jgi:1,4-dihydroxy-2-naphthoate octaprenyltransferase